MQKGEIENSFKIALNRDAYNPIFDVILDYKAGQ
jgi:hypothetical protein